MAACLAMGLVGVWMYYGLKLLTWWEAEPVKRYLINLPKIAEEGNLLEKPSIKVYSPNTQNRLQKLTTSSPKVHLLSNATLQQLDNFLVLSILPRPKASIELLRKPNSHK